MFAINFYDPYVLIFGLLLLAVLVFFWNRKNTANNRNRRQRNFKSGYLERKREREAKQKESNNNLNNTGDNSRLHGNS